MVEHIECTVKRCIKSLLAVKRGVRANYIIPGVTTVGLLIITALVAWERG